MITLDKTKIQPVDFKLEDHAWDKMWEEVNSCVSYKIRNYVSTHIDETIDDFLWDRIIGVVYDQIQDRINVVYD